jgi:hypothetical protein
MSGERSGRRTAISGQVIEIPIEGDIDPVRLFFTDGHASAWLMDELDQAD